MDYKRITYAFVHADIPHLLANIGGQLIFGLLICLELEEKPWIRMAKALTVYLLSVVGGSVAFDYVPEKETCGLVGASAGVFGLCGMLAAEAGLSIVSALATFLTGRNPPDYRSLVWKLILACIKMFLALTLIGIDVYYNLSLPARKRDDGGFTQTLDTLFVHMGGLMSGILVIILLAILNRIFCGETKKQKNDKTFLAT